MVYLVLCLGNPGPTYSKTRHNIGFMVANLLAKETGKAFQGTVRWSVTCCLSMKNSKEHFIVAKPLTYMNLSGKAVKYWLEKEKIPLSNLLVITDDLNLPFGTLRLKTKGSDGGHNGLKDIQSQLNTTKYNRFRFGISDQFSKGQQIDYVLGEWSDDENRELPERLKISAELIESFGTAGVSNTMNSFNGK